MNNGHAEQLNLFDPPPAVVHLGDDHGYFWTTCRGQDVKHGITGDLRKRRTALQTGNPDDLILMGAYPNYSKSLEDAVHKHFEHLRKPGTEWFEVKTTEIKIVALGDGLPIEILEGLSALSNARQALIESQDGASTDIKINNLSLWNDDGWRYRQQNQLISKAMMVLAGSRDEWRARQPIEVQIDQLWHARLAGDNPFDLNQAKLRSSPLLDLLAEFRRLGAA